MTQTKLHLNVDQLAALAELLMGAAYADGDYDGHEAEMIGDTLRALTPSHELPEQVTGRLARFDEATFDPTLACQTLGLNDATQRQAVLALVSKVIEADGVHDLAETAYLERVGHALGASEEELAEHILEIILEDGPPPLPG